MRQTFLDRAPTGRCPDTGPPAHTTRTDGCNFPAVLSVAAAKSHAGLVASLLR